MDIYQVYEKAVSPFSCSQGLLEGMARGTFALFSLGVLGVDTKKYLPFFDTFLVLRFVSFLTGLKRLDFIKLIVF